MSHVMEPFCGRAKSNPLGTKMFSVCKPNINGRAELIRFKIFYWKLVKEAVTVIAFYSLLIPIASLKGRGLSLIALWERKCKVERASTFKRPSTGLNSLLSPGAEDALQRNCWLSSANLGVQPFIALPGTTVICIWVNISLGLILNNEYLMYSYGIDT